MNRIENIQVNQRQKRLLEIIEKFSDVFQHPTSALLHEYILLCQLKGTKKLGFKNYDFRAYMRGPFSDELRDDLEVLFDSDLIGVREGKLVITEQGKVLLQKNRKGKSYENIEETCDVMLKSFNTARALSEVLFDSLRDVPLGERIR